MKQLIRTMLLTAVCWGVPAAAQLREPQVLVIYDSRFPDSVAVAEHYAGSAKVPGGSGGKPGTRPGVNVLNIYSITETVMVGMTPTEVRGGVPDVAGMPNTPNLAFPYPSITWSTYFQSFRPQIRKHLNELGLADQVRCIVLTKGLPHRVWDSDANDVGDNTGPLGAVAELNSGDATYCSLDSELVLLWQNTAAAENGGAGDSRADGMIINPQHRRAVPVTAWSNRARESVKSYLGSPTGVIWRNATSFQSGVCNPGDLILTARLDGNTVAEVTAALDRALNPTLDMTTAAVVLDESNSNGVQNVSDTDGEIDNDGPTSPSPAINAGDDFEQARDYLLTTDPRLNPANVFYNAAAGADQFVLGPRRTFPLQGSIVVNGPVALLATEGANHTGLPTGAGSQYAESFIYAPAAVFNTIESFNGRKFGGLGDNGQEQCADFIAAGGTFAIGMVWEPFSISVADNNFLVRNFLQGNMSWGEAAWSAIPVMSWQHVVIGDPLARARRVQEDINNDGRLTIDDLFAWFEPPGPNAGPRDLNRSGTADNADLAILEAAVRAFESAQNGTAGR